MEEGDGSPVEVPEKDRKWEETQKRAKAAKEHSHQAPRETSSNTHHIPEIW